MADDKQWMASLSAMDVVACTIIPIRGGQLEAENHAAELEGFLDNNTSCGACTDDNGETWAVYVMEG